MSAAPNTLRIAGVKLQSYRAFPNSVTLWLASHTPEGKVTGKGKHLLLYGENGSGKSSFGKALRDILDFRTDAVVFDEYKYRHTDPPDEDRHVTLIFDDPSVDHLVWKPEVEGTGGRYKGHPFFVDMARCRSWLDYRRVWRASEVQYGDSVEIFSALVEEILPSCQMGTTNETFGQVWATILQMANKNPRRIHAERPLLKSLVESIERFNDFAKTFLTELESYANQLLREFAPWTEMDLKWEGDVGYNPSSHTSKFSLGSVRLRMRDRGGDPLKKPSEFINEARVTAIGLCLYLAGLARSIPPSRADGATYPRLLILDDVLLSLDMTHRLPLLKLLKGDGFQSWQIFLLTHDRAWYEIAKQQLGEGWAHYELFSQQVGDYEQPILCKDQDHLMQAIDFLHDGNVKAAAVHVRTKFELVLKSACNELGLAVKYHPDPRKMPASDFWEAVNGATFDKIPPVGRKVTDDGKQYWWQPKIDRTSVVPLELKQRITHALSWVMNPLSHSQSVDRYRPEIEEAIFAVSELEHAIREAITMRQAGPVMLREMLLTLINSRTSPTT